MGFVEKIGGYRKAPAVPPPGPAPITVAMTFNGGQIHNFVPQANVSEMSAANSYVTYNGTNYPLGPGNGWGLLDATGGAFYFDNSGGPGGAFLVTLDAAGVGAPFSITYIPT